MADGVVETLYLPERLDAVLNVVYLVFTEGYAPTRGAIAAEHGRARTAVDTNWSAIVGWYDLLMTSETSPVVALNRAVAVAMRDGPEAGLREMAALAGNAALEGHPLFHSSRAELLRRAGLLDTVADGYRKALALTTNDAERRFLERRLADTPQV